METRELIENQRRDLLLRGLFKQSLKGVNAPILCMFGIQYLSCTRLDQFRKTCWGVLVPRFWNHCKEDSVSVIQTFMDYYATINLGFNTECHKFDCIIYFIYLKDPLKMLNSFCEATSLLHGEILSFTVQIQADKSLDKQ